MIFLYVKINLNEMKLKKNTLQTSHLKEKVLSMNKKTFLKQNLSLKKVIIKY